MLRRGEADKLGAYVSSHESGADGRRTCGAARTRTARRGRGTAASVRTQRLQTPSLVSCA